MAMIQASGQASTTEITVTARVICSEFHNPCRSEGSVKMRM